jgi:hypothetical protein
MVKDASGNKRRQSVYKDGILIKTTDFTDNCVYEDGKFGWLNFDNGRVIWESKNRVLFEHHLKDHLGNVMVVFSNDGNATKVQQVNSYYPCGLRINNLSADWVFYFRKLFLPLKNYKAFYH